MSCSAQPSFVKNSIIVHCFIQLVKLVFILLLIKHKRVNDKQRNLTYWSTKEWRTECHNTQLSIPTRSGVTRMEALLFDNSRTKTANYFQFKAQHCQNYVSHEKKLGIEIVRNWISYKKVHERAKISTSPPPRVELVDLKDLYGLNIILY